MARDVDSKKTTLASCAPPIRYSNIYGIDMPSRHEFAAHEQTIPATAEEIGADLVIYQTLPELAASVRQLNPAIEKFDCSAFTGEYITGGVDRAYLNGLEEKRSGGIKASNPLLNGHQVNSTGTKLAESKESLVGSNGPMNGTDDGTIGLHNSWQL